MKNYKLALVGATGLVGRTAMEVLTEFNLPISEYVFFASTKSAGEKLTFQKRRVTFSTDFVSISTQLPMYTAINGMYYR